MTKRRNFPQKAPTTGEILSRVKYARNDAVNASGLVATLERDLAELPERGAHRTLIATAERELASARRCDVARACEFLALQSRFGTIESLQAQFDTECAAETTADVRA